MTVPVTYDLTIRADDILQGASTDDAVIELLVPYGLNNVVKIEGSIISETRKVIPLVAGETAVVPVYATESYNQDTLYRFTVNGRKGYFSMPAANSNLYDILQQHPTGV